VSEPFELTPTGARPVRIYVMDDFSCIAAYEESDAEELYRDTYGVLPNDSNECAADSPNHDIVRDREAAGDKLPMILWEVE